jgi:hypothetical protein
MPDPVAACDKAPRARLKLGVRIGAAGKRFNVELQESFDVKLQLVNGGVALSRLDFLVDDAAIPNAVVSNLCSEMTAIWDVIMSTFSGASNSKSSRGDSIDSLAKGLLGLLETRRWR